MDVLRADLPDELHSEMEALARGAFRALGLRDYARFDIRLSSGGTLFFLEANTTPSLEPLEALALSARWAGLDYPALVERMLSAALRRYGVMPPGHSRSVRIDLTCGTIDLQIPEGVHVPPASSIELAKLLDVRQGDEVLDLGCGSGLLSIAAAKLGARRVALGRDRTPPPQADSLPAPEGRIAAGGGMDHEAIALAIGISTPTLKKHYARELSTGAHERRLQVLEAAFKAAVSGKISAQRLYLSATPGAAAPDPDPEPAGDGKPLGKKAEANEAAKSAHVGSEWEDLLGRPAAPGVQ